MKFNLKKIFSFSILLFIFMNNGCMPKQADGKYHTKYSYHPYYKLYKDEIAGSRNSYQATRISKVTPTSSSRKVAYNDEDNYPSNIPADSH